MNAFIGARGAMLYRALELRAVRVGLVVHLLAAVVLSFVPLFDVLGFERAFVTGVISGPVAAFIAVAIGRAERAGAIESAVEAGSVAFLLLIPGALAGATVELFSQSCAPGEGLAFLALLAGSTALFGVALGIAAHALVPRRAGVLVVLFYLGALLLALRRLYVEPQIYAYSMALGYWPGSLYDEEVSITTALTAHRAMTILLALGVIGLVISVHDTTLRFPKVRAFAFIFTAFLLASAAAIQVRGETLGFARDRHTIEAVLSRRVETDEVRIFVDPSIDKEQLERLVADHQLRYRQLQRFFGKAPGKITSYVYRDVGQKRELMGAANTQIARPWQAEFHIHGFEVPHPVLKHEMAHVFASTMARGFFKVPAKAGVLVNLGIVEGTAVAADWPARELTIHGWARAMRALDLAPDPRKTLYPTGFWSISSSRAYTVAGSFIRYLIETHGIERFATLYATNDFLRAYGRPLDALASEWEQFIDQEPLPEAELRMAEHRFKQPGIFQKTCAHASAALERDGYALLGSGDVARGIEKLERVAAYGAEAPDTLLAIAQALMKQDQLPEARAWAERAKRAKGATEKSRGQAEALLGDVAWKEGKLEEAQQRWSTVLPLHLSTAGTRLLEAKLEAISRPADMQEILRPALLGGWPESLALVRVGDGSRVWKSDGLLHYLYGYRLEQAGAYPEGAWEMAMALAAGVPGEALPHEARMSLARQKLAAGEARAAKEDFERLARTATRAADRLNAQDWAERASQPWSRGTAGAAAAE